MRALQKMPISGVPAERWTSRALNLFSAVITFCADDDVACLILIITMLSAGEDIRNSLFDGFRCDCIKIFLHPLFLEFVYRTILWWIFYGVAGLRRKAHAYCSRCMARITGAPGVSSALVR